MTPADRAELIEQGPPFCQRDHFLGFLCELKPGHDGSHTGLVGGRTWGTWVEDACRQGRVIVCEVNR